MSCFFDDCRLKYLLSLIEDANGNSLRYFYNHYQRKVSGINTSERCLFMVRVPFYLSLIRQVFPSMLPGVALTNKLARIA